MPETEQRYTEWEEILELQRESGLSKREFCEQAGINRKRFFAWQKKIRERKEAGTAVGFSRVDVMEPASSGLSLCLPSGMKVELSSNFDGDALRRFLKVACSC